MQILEFKLINVLHEKDYLVDILIAFYYDRCTNIKWKKAAFSLNIFYKVLYS